MDLVTVETFWSVEEAQLALGFLESEEIPCRLESLAFASNFWYLANAAGGVKLLVAGEAAQRAAALLTAAHHHEIADIPSETELQTDPLGDSESTVDGDQELVSDPVSEVEAADDDVDHPGLLERIRKFKPLAFLLVITGG